MMGVGRVKAHYGFRAGKDVEEGRGDRVGWNREKDLCFHPTDPGP